MTSYKSVTRRRLASLALALAAGVRAAPASEPLLVAQVLELTGGQSDAGDSWRSGVEMAVQEINAAGGLLGRLVQVTTFDTQSSPGGARAALVRALDGNPIAVLGPATVGAARGLLTMPRGGRPLLLGGRVDSLVGPLHPCAFLAVPSYAATMARLAGWLRNEGHTRRLAILSHPAEPFRDQGEAMAHAARTAGLDVAAEAVVAGDFTTELAHLLRAGPDTLAILLPPGAAGRAAAQVRHESSNVSLVGGEALIAPNSIEAAGAAAEGLRAHVLLADDASAPELRAFQNRFLTRDKELPDEMVLAGYVALGAVRAAVELAGRTEPQALCEALRRAKVMDSAGWDSAGDSTRPSWVVEMRQGRVVMLKMLNNQS